MYIFEVHKLTWVWFTKIFDNVSVKHSYDESYFTVYDDVYII